MAAGPGSAGESRAIDTGCEILDTGCDMYEGLPLAIRCPESGIKDEEGPKQRQLWEYAKRSNKEKWLDILRQSVNSAEKRWKSFFLKVKDV